MAGPSLGTPLSADLLGALLNALPAHVALLDPLGRISGVNEAWVRSAEERSALEGELEVGADYLAFCDASAAGDGGERPLAAGIRAVLEGTQTAFMREYRSRSLAGERWFRLMVTPFVPGERKGAVVMHVDITDRVVAEAASKDALDDQRALAEELARERTRLVAAQEVAKVGSWETDLQTLGVIWSAETFHIFGLDSDVFVPDHDSFLQFVHPEDRSVVDAAFRDSFRTRDVRTVEHRVLAADGTVKYVEERWQTFVDASGNPLRAVGTCQDISERKRLESQHLRAQRLESLGTLAGGIAHDLNNVLTPILASIELLRLDDSPEGRAESLATIETSAQRGAEMVKQVLAFARGSEGANVPVNVRTVLRDVVKILQETMQKNVTVRVDDPDALWQFRGDSTQLHQVLMNLGVNARDAMPKGGTLTFALSNVVLDDVYSGMNPQSRPGAYVRIEVQDTGEGIAPAVMDRIFEPFFTTKEQGRGTGLGLSTVHTIVRSHGGFVNVYSEIGRGARFSVYLPAIEVGAEASAAVTTKPGLPRRNGECVLVVDDEEAIRTVVRRTLERYGYRVLEAANGADGVAVYADHRAEIAVVLTDMAMPILDGPSMIRALRAINPQVRIVGSSGLTSYDGILPAIGSAVQRWVPKPYSALALLTALHEAIHDS